MIACFRQHVAIKDGLQADLQVALRRYPAPGLPVDDDGLSARFQRQQIVFGDQAATRQLRLQCNFGVALRRQTGQARRAEDPPPGRQFRVIVQRTRQRVRRHTQKMLLHQLMEAGALPCALLELERRYGFHRRVAQPLDVT